MSYKFAILTVITVLIFPYSSHGQEMTEKYIPIDAYPNIAVANVTVGTIVSVDKDMRSLTLQSDGSIQNFLVSDATKIWLDRSLLKKSNGDGTFADLRAGLRAEVSVLAPREKGVARWIKVQIASQ